MNDRARHETPSTAPAAIAKVSSRIPGLDAILHGGLPEGRMALLVGGPGTGKTIIALEFLYRAALAGEPGVLVAFEERADAIRSNAASLGWDLSPLEQAGKLFVFEAHIDPKTIVAGDFTFLPMLSILEGQMRALGAKHVVLDAIDVPLRLFGNAERERAELYFLHDWLSDQGMTSLLTAKTGEGTAPRYEFLDYMANTVIWLDQRVQRQSSVRRLRVIKYRGSGFDRNEYPYVIGRSGIGVLPITSARLHHKPLGNPVPTGMPDVDRMLAGGILQGSCTLVAGTSGTGKTIFATTFARAAAERGERILYIGFEESAEAMLGAVRSAGIDLQPIVDRGLLRIDATLPEAMGAEEHLISFVTAMREFDAKHVVLDAASATERFRTETGAFDFLVRFINACKEDGRTCLMTNQLRGIESADEVTGLGISSIVDSVVLLRRTESSGEFVRTLFVLKSRGSAHSNQAREFVITDRGIEMPQVYTGEGGVVSGVERQEREARDAAEARRQERLLHARETEVARMKAALRARSAEVRARIELAEADIDSMRLEKRLRESVRQRRARTRGGNAPTGDDPCPTTHPDHPKQ